MLSDDLMGIIQDKFPELLSMLTQLASDPSTQDVINGTAERPDMKDVEYDEDEREVIVKIVFKPKPAVDIVEYANSVDVFLRSVVKMLVSLVMPSDE
ncbi:MAG: hypothetical protein RXS23_10815 [Metallosphaera yellowstonensis]|jgi:hypothetical protein